MKLSLTRLHLKISQENSYFQALLRRNICNTKSFIEPNSVYGKCKIYSFICLCIYLFSIHSFFFPFFSSGCGLLVNNSLTSPGYPNPSPESINCVYTVSIPYDKAMEIYFEDFDVGYWRWSG